MSLGEVMSIFNICDFEAKPDSKCDSKMLYVLHIGTFWQASRKECGPCLSFVLVEQSTEYVVESLWPL